MFNVLVVPKYVCFSVASWETIVPRSTAPIGRGRICFKEIVAKSTSLGYLDAVSVAAVFAVLLFLFRCWLFALLPLLFLFAVACFRLLLLLLLQFQYLRSYYFVLLIVFDFICCLSAVGSRFICKNAVDQIRL